MRTVTQLLKTTYASLVQNPDRELGEVLYDKWKDSESGEAVAAEAFATLDAAAREVSGEKRLRYWGYQKAEHCLKALFNHAMAVTEAKKQTAWSGTPS